MVLGMRRMPLLPKGNGRGWRGIALVLVLGAALFGFWKNAERQMQIIGQRGAVMDEIGSLTGDQLDKLREMSAALKENYGVKVTILVSKGEIEWPKSGEAPLELFIAVAPEHEEAVMSFSPLLRRGLDEEFCYKLQHEVLEAQVRDGQLFRALAESLTRLWQRLGAIS